MKKHLLKLSVFLAVGGIAFFTSMQTVSSRSAGGASIAYCSGSPFDGTDCTNNGSCHPGPAVKAPANWVTSNVPKSGYIPGATYTITCRAVNKNSGNNSNFGFEFTPQEQKTGNGGVVGTLTNITTSGKGATQVVTSSPSAWMTHTSSSYSGTDSCVWSFKWKAPSPGVGAVNYYAAFNCGSGDNQG
ncbi:MAG TPA: choice-of-anchor V domain-containing protein, partial [Bacteroidia bacterium]|nr:choice-of-anchor V domain-containing protein [Bacteroidia bacterium]